MNFKTKRLSIIIITIIALLCIPLIAMLFSTEINWSLFDFVIAGILLFSSGLVIEFTLQNIKSTRNRILISGLVLLILFLVWAELAVGVFGSPIAGN